VSTIKDKHGASKGIMESSKKKKKFLILCRVGWLNQNYNILIKIYHNHTALIEAILILIEGEDHIKCEPILPLSLLLLMLAKL
jgi:hypothetical protein